MSSLFHHWSKCTQEDRVHQEPKPSSSPQTQENQPRQGRTATVTTTAPAPAPAQVSLHTLNAGNKHRNYVSLRDSFRNHIQQEARPKVAAKLGAWTLLQVREDEGRLTVDAMVNQQGQPIYSMTRELDGTVTFHAYGRKVPDHPPNFNNPIWKLDLPRWTASELLRHAASHLDKRVFTNYIMVNFDHDLREIVQETADAMVKEAAVPATQEGCPLKANLQFVTYDNLVQKANTIIRKHLLDHQAERLSIDLFKSHYSEFEHSTNDYNAVFINRDIFLELQQTSPNALWLYANLIAKKHHKPVRLAHPGQVIQAVKDTLQLTPGQWNYFCRIPTEELRRTPPRNVQESTRLYLKALAQANQPEAPQRELDRIIHFTTEHQFFSQAYWHHGNPWQAWVQLISRYLATQADREGDAKEYQQQGRDLQRVADALRNHVDENLPWGPGDWDTLWQRSERWHAQQLQRNNARHLENQEKAKAATWDSPIETLSVNSIRFDAVTNGRDLIELADRMKNCLGSFVQRCANGEARIFTAHQADTLVGAVEVRNANGQWLAGQVEGPQWTRPSKALRKAAEKLSAACREREAAEIA